MRWSDDQVAAPMAEKISETSLQGEREGRPVLVDGLVEQAEDSRQEQVKLQIMQISGLAGPASQIVHSKSNSRLWTLGRR